jgi:hypothetical protein
MAPANKLLKSYMENISPDKLPGYLESPLILIATLRNKLDAHGAGAAPHAPPAHLAKYSLHATASAIVLLVDAAK